MLYKDSFAAKLCAKFYLYQITIFHVRLECNFIKFSFSGHKPSQMYRSNFPGCMIEQLAAVHVVVPIDGLVQERRNFSALGMELCLSCINPSQ